MYPYLTLLSVLCFIDWKHKIPNKVKIFLWSLAYRNLNTHDKLQRKFQNLPLSPFIHLCLREMETVDHLLFSLACWSVCNFMDFVRCAEY